MGGGSLRVTLEMVAARAGVSRATVSRVVNGSTTVDPTIRARVLRAVSDLGYVPNQAARSLVTHRSDSIGLVLAEARSRVFSDDQFFPGLILGISQELEAADQQLVLLMATDPSSHGRIERYGRAGHVDGLIIASGHVPDPLPATLLRTGLPVVSNERSFAGEDVPFVGVDQIGGVRQAIDHLVAIGRSRVATIAGPQDMVAGIDRLAGYRAAVADRDVRSIVAVGDFTRASGETAMRQLLDDDPDLDAVFVASDLMALGALGALHQAGRRVPDDVAVIGFDDVDLCRSTQPPLTTVRQPIVELGHALARQVLRLSRGEEIEPAVVLPTSLVPRDSA